MKYYCLGIKGSGMATLACLLHDLGNTVLGYDDVSEWKFTQKGLDERNISIFYNGEHSLDKDMIVTYSKALSEDHPELKRVREKFCVSGDFFHFLSSSPAVLVSSSLTSIKPVLIEALA